MNKGQATLNEQGAYHSESIKGTSHFINLGDVTLDELGTGHSK